MGKIKTSTRSCIKCGTIIRENNKSGYCRPHSHLCPAIRASRSLWAKTKQNKAVASKRSIEWAKRHKHKKNALTMARVASKNQRTPKWLTESHHEQILYFYAIARLRESIFLKRFAVDHIVPLNGKVVSGLHVPWNLQVITMSENCSKSNKLTTGGVSC